MAWRSVRAESLTDFRGDRLRLPHHAVASAFMHVTGNLAIGVLSLIQAVNRCCSLSAPWRRRNGCGQSLESKP